MTPTPRRHAGGYTRVFVPGHPIANADGYALEHRYVLYEAGLVLPKGWHVHHINGDRTDNRLENLTVLTAKAHTHLHLRENPVVLNQHGASVAVLDPAARKERERARNAATADYRREYYRRRRAEAGT